MRLVTLRLLLEGDACVGADLVLAWMLLLVAAETASSAPLTPLLILLVFASLPVALGDAYGLICWFTTTSGPRCRRRAVNIHSCRLVINHSATATDAITSLTSSSPI